MKVREKKTGKVYNVIVETHYYILDCNGKIFAEYEGEEDEDFELVNNLDRVETEEKMPNPNDSDVWPNATNCNRNCKTCMAKCMYRKKEYKEEKQ